MSIECDAVPVGRRRSVASGCGCRADLKQTQTTCAPCLPRLLGGAHTSASVTSLDMSGLFKKVKKKAKGVADSLKPLSRQGRSPSPVPHASGQSTPNAGTNPPPTPPLQPQPSVTALPSSPVHSATPPHGPDLAQPALMSSSSSSAGPTPAYARPSTPPSALVTTGSVIHDLLTTIRDASDMCLPLKAAVVGVLKIWDVCEVRCFATDLVYPTNSHIVAHRAAQPGIHQAQGETRATPEDHSYTPRRNRAE